VSVEAIDPTGAALTESARGHKIESVTAGGIATEIAWEGGAEVRSDGRFRYRFDDFGRLVAMTEIATYTGQRIRRMLYSYDGRDRMVGRRAESAIASSLTASPAESDWTLETRAAVLEADGLPAEVTFAWDPLSDRLVSLHAAGASGGSGDPYGGVVRQIVHGGLAYDDPLEVTLRTREGAGARLTRLYPVFGEAADGLLDVILNERGELVARNVPNDAYGGGSELSAGGAAIDRIAVTAKKNGEGEVTEVEVTLRATDALAGPTLAAGLRLAAVDGQGRLVRSSSAAPQLFENDANSARFILTRSDWNALVSTEPETVGGEERIAAAISIAATKHLRAAAWAAETPIAAAPEWATVTRPLYTSPELPIEVRESLSSLASFLAGIPAGSERSTTLYEIDGLALLASEEPNPAIAQLGIATFHAYPFTEPANGKVYARARWYDPQTGTFTSPDPMGYVDSSNMYAFCGGDPVNCRDPRGEESLREWIHGFTEDQFAKDGNILGKAAAVFGEVAYAAVEVASVGSVGKIDAAQEALDRREISRSAYWKRTSVAVAQTAATYTGGAAVSVVTARTAARVAGGRAATAAGARVIGTTAGAAGSAGGLAASDAVGVGLGAQDGFSSATDYATAVAVGGAFGYAANQKYLDTRGKLRTADGRFAPTRGRSSRPGRPASAEFTTAQKQRFRNASRETNEGNLKCVDCGFENPADQYFDVDHPRAVRDGGGRNQVGEIKCVGCNRSNGADAAKPGSDYATRYPGLDKRR
jgi:RHS repeat-associated protein